MSTVHGYDHTNGFGITLWHSTHSTESGVAYISLTAAPGTVTVSEKSLPRNSLPRLAELFLGFASFQFHYRI
jgi:hypothetical protein